MEQRCQVCRGEATSSTAQCTCRRCANCGVWTTQGRLCATCQTRPQCGACKRHLPTACYDGGPLCRACTNRRQRPPTTRNTLHDVVSEVDLPTTTQPSSFGDYITNNADRIQQVVQEHPDRHR